MPKNKLFGGGNYNYKASNTALKLRFVHFIEDRLKWPPVGPGTNTIENLSTSLAPKEIVLIGTETLRSKMEVLAIILIYIGDRQFINSKKIAQQKFQ